MGEMRPESIRGVNGAVAEITHARYPYVRIT